MGLNIKIISPLVPHIYKEVDIDDFYKVDVLIKGELNSNHFLLSLWNQLNINLAPDHSLERVPWAYFPKKYVGKKNAVSLLGSINTKVGNYFVAISYREKGDIDSIHFYSPTKRIDECKSHFQEIIKKSIDSIGKLLQYKCTAIITSGFENLSCEKYTGKNFVLYTDNDSILLSFNLLAIDKIEAYRSSMKRLNYFRAFLCVETNILFEFGNITIEESSNMIVPTDESVSHFSDFIDFYPIDGSVLKLSKYGILLMDTFIFMDRELADNDKFQYFISACQHIQEGLSNELKLREIPKYLLREHIFTLSPRELKEKQTFITLGVMSYMSAIETATVLEGKSEKCTTCSALKYGISSRIANFMAQYLNEDIGKIYKSLYSFRSKYLHTGILATDNDYLFNTPLVDSSTATGLIDYGFISVKLNGGNATFFINNIREYTTYALRCYYQESFFGRTSFDDLSSKEDENDISYVPKYNDIVIKSNIPGITIESFEIW